MGRSGSGVVNGGPGTGAGYEGLKLGGGQLTLGLLLLLFHWLPIRARLISTMTIATITKRGIPPPPLLDDVTG